MFQDASQDFTASPVKTATILLPQHIKSISQCLQMPTQKKSAVAENAMGTGHV